MKKLTVVSFALIIVLLFSGCSKKPSGMSDEEYQLGVDGVAICDQLIKGQLTLERAQEKIGALEEECNELDSYEGLPSRLAFSTLSLGLWTYKVDGEENIGDFIDDRNSFAKTFNIQEYKE
ncbi:MAG: hypothetical protein ACK5MN_02990 [Lachnospiraceae bacterium]